MGEDLGEADQIDTDKEYMMTNRPQVNERPGISLLDPISSILKRSSSTGDNMSDPVPAAAAAVGYDTETLSGPITAGRTWLPDTIHGDGSPNVTYNSNGSVTIAGGGDPWNGQLTTALPTWPGYTGEVFGGGFYAQATVTVAGATSGLSPWTGGNDGDQWPSFWANSSNNATDYNTIETDFMELEDGTPGQYQATIINWTTDPQQGIGQTITAPAGDHSYQA